MFSDQYEEKFFEIGMMYLKGYKNNLQTLKGKHWFTLEMLQTNIVPKEILSTLYQTMVKREKLIAIENLSQEEKVKLWSDAKPLTTGMDKKNCLKIAQSIHVLENLNNELDA